MNKNNLENSISKLKETVDNDFRYFIIHPTNEADACLGPKYSNDLRKERDKIQSLIRSVIVLSYFVSDFNKTEFDLYQRFDFVASFVNDPLGKIMGWIKDKSQYQSVDDFNDELNNLTSLNNIYGETYGATHIIDFLVACQDYINYGKKAVM